MDNTVTITGNATREPELRYTPGGQAVANFGVAVNRRWQNRNTQEWEEAVSFFDITVWAKLAENVSETVSKGSRVTVTGRLDQRSWETQDGEKRSKVEIVADDVAVSLRWATATITRNQREDNDGGSSGGGGGYQVAAPSGGAPAGGTPNGAPAYNPDEEPF